MELPGSQIKPVSVQGWMHSTKPPLGFLFPPFIFHTIIVELHLQCSLSWAWMKSGGHMVRNFKHAGTGNWLLPSWWFWEWFQLSVIMQDNLPWWVGGPGGLSPWSSRRSCRHFLAQQREIRYAHSVSFIQISVCFLSLLHFIWWFPDCLRHSVYFAGLQTIHTWWPPVSHLILPPVIVLSCNSLQKHSFADLMESVAADGWSIALIITELKQMFQSNISSVLHVSVFCVPSLLSHFWSVCKWDTSTGIWSKRGLWSSGCLLHT